MLLAFDTATTRVTVALHDGERVVASLDSDEGLRHGELLAPAIQRVLRDADATPQDVSAIAVGVGPGPFTGLRVGLVTARTMALALGIPVHGVCTLDILAAEAVDAGLDDFLVATDARRKEVYLASYVGGHRAATPGWCARPTWPPTGPWSAAARRCTPRRSRTPPLPSTRARSSSATSWCASATSCSTPSRSTSAGPT